ncbi:MAG TPA: HlyD family efflux transporter periplasmic adaptor subunit [Candidatus Polarisedimenticolia bacterium]|jgi:HlyD family secretion protein|nr:HlyD family efflux transporter periplasmic adaptor subunit [Candidatus Polarisedimenticolia bacterium]
MDVARPINKRKRTITRTLYGIGGVTVLAAITVGLSHLKPAAPSVSRATVWVDTVKRGPMLRQVRGLGTLVPEEIRWIPAATEGRVERILIKPGSPVTPDSVIVELSNPELENTANEAEWQMKAAEADYTTLKVRLQSQFLDQKAEFATVEANARQAKLQAAADEELATHGLISDLALKLSKSRAEELDTRQNLDRERLEIAAESTQAELASQTARLEQLRAQTALRRNQVRQLRVRAGIEGVLQQLPVEVGQRLAPGATLAKVTVPGRLKAELKIAETQAKDIQIGQPASIDTRNGVVKGSVSRIDPAVQGGTVTVDVALAGTLPKGARPDLSVEGTIELERLNEVLYVGRPAFGQEQGVVGLFRLADEGNSAVRVQVKLGRSSVNTVEILEGLDAGDQVILSDTSAWDAFDRLRLN